MTEMTAADIWGPYDVLLGAARQHYEVQQERRRQVEARWPAHMVLMGRVASDPGMGAVKARLAARRAGDVPFSAVVEAAAPVAERHGCMKATVLRMARLQARAGV